MDKPTSLISCSIGDEGKKRLKTLKTEAKSTQPSAGPKTSSINIFTFSSSFMMTQHSV
jgi:hypothetical protein